MQLVVIRLDAYSKQREEGEEGEEKRKVAKVPFHPLTSIGRLSLSLPY